MDSADAPLVVDCLYGDGHRQLRRPVTRGGSGLGDLLAAAAARVAAVQRLVFVRAAVYRQEAQRAKHRFGWRMIVAKTAKAQPKADANWREDTLARMRALILEADPEIVEERKWRKPSNPAGVPVWSRHG